MISKFLAHAHGGLCTYNFLVSQRLCVILAENLLQTPEATTIWMDFAMAQIQATKIDPKDRKRTDCRGRIREPIAPGNAITHGCNQFTNQVKCTRARGEALKNASASEFCQFGSISISPTSVFSTKV